MLKYANCTTKVSIFVQFWGITNVAKQLCPQLKPKKSNELIKLLNDLLHRQVQKVGPDQLGPLVRVGSTRIDSDRIKKIKMNKNGLGSTRINKKINLISKTENLTHLDREKGQIILFSLRGFQPPFCFTSASSSRIMLRTRGCFDTTRVVQIWMTWRKIKSRSLASFQRSRLECIYLLIFKCTELFTRKASKAWSVGRI